jgi:hypothetical protein
MYSTFDFKYYNVLEYSNPFNNPVNFAFTEIGICRLAPLV